MRYFALAEWCPEWHRWRLRDEIPPMIYVPIAQSAGMRPPGLTTIDISIRSSGARRCARPGCRSCFRRAWIRISR